MQIISVYCIMKRKEMSVTIKIKLLLGVIVLFNCAFCVAQDINPNAGKKYQLGFNTTNFIKKVISPSSQVLSRDPDNPYLLTFKYFLTNKQAIRFGGNYSYQYLHGNINGPNTDASLKTHIADFRLGYEINGFITNKWQYYWGLDALYSVEAFKNHRSNTGNSTYDINSLTRSVGGGPVVGLQYNITKRISIATESKAYILWDYSKQVSDYGANHAEQISRTQNIKFFAPASLFLYLYF